MICPDYYTPDNLLGDRENITIKSYLRKDYSKVISTTEYEVQQGDTIYSIGYKLFKGNNEHFWSIVYELNPMRDMDELVPGETILLPSVVLNEILYRPISYAGVTSTSVAI